MANDDAPGLAPYCSRIGSGSWRMSIASGTAICMRKASSYWLIRVRVSGSPNSASSYSLSCLQRVERAAAVCAVHALGIADVEDRVADRPALHPLVNAGQKAVLQSALPPVGSVPPLIRTTKPGRSWFSEPSP